MDVQELKDKLYGLDRTLSVQEESKLIGEWVIFNGDKIGFIIVEELSELIQAIVSFEHNCNESTRMNLIEEMADVQIVLEYCKKKYSHVIYKPIETNNVLTNYIDAVTILSELIQMVSKYERAENLDALTELLIHKRDIGKSLGLAYSVLNFCKVKYNISGETLLKIRTIKLTRPKKL